jgi:hypothetical protein
VEIVIEHSTPDDAQDFVFQSGEVFDTAQDAEEAAIALGERIVDGKSLQFKLP